MKAEEFTRFGFVYKSKPVDITPELRKQLEDSTWIIHNEKQRKGWGK